MPCAPTVLSPKDGTPLPPATIHTMRFVHVSCLVAQLDHPRRQGNPGMSLKAELAANAAVIRSMREEERRITQEKEALERRGGEAGERRRGAEEHVSLLRVDCGC